MARVIGNDWYSSKQEWCDRATKNWREQVYDNMSSQFGTAMAKFLFFWPASMGYNKEIWFHVGVDTNQMFDFREVFVFNPKNNFCSTMETIAFRLMRYWLWKFEIYELVWGSVTKTWVAKSKHVSRNLTHKCEREIVTAGACRSLYVYRISVARICIQTAWEYLVSNWLYWSKILQYFNGKALFHD